MESEYKANALMSASLSSSDELGHTSAGTTSVLSNLNPGNRILTGRDGLKAVRSPSGEAVVRAMGREMGRMCLRIVISMRGLGERSWDGSLVRIELECGDGNGLS